MITPRLASILGPLLQRSAVQSALRILITLIWLDLERQQV